MENPSSDSHSPAEQGTTDAVVDSVVAEHRKEGKEEKETDAFSLAHEFYDVYKLCQKLGKEEPWPETERADLATRLRSIAFHVVQLRLFSPNEELDDISTADLKFLLVPFLLGEVMAATRDMDSRLTALRNAMIYWRAFANDCQRLKVAHAEDLKAIDRGPEEALDANSKREEKIARYKRSKELDEKVEYLFSKKREVLGDEFHWGAGGAFDEDMERELILTLLGRAVATVADNISLAEQEVPLLEMMAAQGGPGKGPKPRPQPVEKPFIVRIQDKAELMRLYKEMVFQCPFAQPTVTLAEAAEADLAALREREARSAERARYQQAEEDDRWWGGDRTGSKEDAEDEAKTYKDRSWDDWKDEHPWGSGNKMANVG